MQTCGTIEAHGGFDLDRPQRMANEL